MPHCALQCADCGAFYSGRDWTYRGNRITRNVFHTVRSIFANGRLATHAVYLDDEVSSFLIDGNTWLNPTVHPRLRQSCGLWRPPSLPSPPLLQNRALLGTAQSRVHLAAAYCLLSSRIHKARTVPLAQSNWSLWRNTSDANWLPFPAYSPTTKKCTLAAVPISFVSEPRMHIHVRATKWSGKMSSSSAV